jgi:hypothetical protein
MAVENIDAGYTNQNWTRICSQYSNSVLVQCLKHCMLNEIEIAWATLTNYVRDRNINFTRDDV